MNGREILDCVCDTVVVDDTRRDELAVLAESMNGAATRLEHDIFSGRLGEIQAAADRGSLTDDEHTLLRWSILQLRTLIEGIEREGGLAPAELVDELEDLERWARPRLDQYEAERLDAVRALTFA